MPNYRVEWLDKDGNTVGHYFYYKQTEMSALMSACRRVLQSSHLIPEKTCSIRVSEWETQVMDIDTDAPLRDISNMSEDEVKSEYERLMAEMRNSVKAENP